MLDDLRYRLRALLRRGQVERELGEELAYHLEREAAKLREAGAEPEEAMRRARLALGGEEQARQAVRDGRGTALVEDVTRDLGYALRQLWRSPVYALTALATLALAVGAAMTMASVVRTVLLAPLPYPEPGRLVGVGFEPPDEPVLNKQTGSTARFVLDHARSFAAVSVYTEGTSGANLTLGAGDGGRGSAMQVAVQGVDRGFFPALGIEPVVGHGFTAEEDRHNAPKVVVLSYGLWQRVFAGDGGVVGRAIRLNGETATVVGVMPEGFSFASEDYRSLTPTADLWQPLRLDRGDAGYEGTNYRMLARLGERVTLEQARQELATLNGPLVAENPYLKRWIGSTEALPVYQAWPLGQVLAAGVRSSVVTLTGAVGAVLLVACLNLAGLNAARASRRQKEMALRSALGASRMRILRLLLTESLVLAVVGSALGVAVSVPMLRLLLENAPTPIVRAGASGAAMAALALPLVVGVTLLCGLVPAWLVLRQNAASRLQAGHGVGVTAAGNRMGRTLLVSQTAVAVVLLSAAALLLGVFLRLRATPLGVDAEYLTVAQVNLKGEAYASAASTAQFVDRVVGRLEQTPGVERAAAVNGLLLDRGINIVVTPPDNGKDVVVELRLVTPGYFQTVGTPLLAGRGITEEDRRGGRAVVVVSQAFARRWWPGETPAAVVGQAYHPGRKPSDTDPVVVGVVGDAHTHSLAEPAALLAYEPFAQQEDRFAAALNNWFRTSFVLRTRGRVDVAAAIDAALREADPGIPVSRVTTMQAMIDHSLAQPRFFSALVTAFAGFALLLTVIGLFGLLSYQVTERTREIGVRMALGASRGNVLGFVLRRGLGLTLAGLLLGTLASLALPQVLRSLLDSSIYTAGSASAAASWSTVMALAIAVGAMALAAAVASYLPARRAASVDPLEALRME